MMLPFDFTKNDFKKSGSSDGLTGHFYEFQGLQLNTQTGEWEPKLTKEVTTMKANTPYIYVPDDEPEYWYSDNGGLGVNIFTEGNDGGNKTVTDEYGLWTLTGAYEPKSFTSADFNIMVLNDDGELGEVTGATTVAPTSGYFVRDNTANSVNVSPSIGGTVTADPLYAKENDTVTLTVTPNAGYAVKRVWVDGDEITPVDGVYSFTMPTRQVIVDAEFEAIGYTISKTADHGTISAKVGDAIVTTANYGESVTLDVSPDTGYTVKSVKVGNTEIEPVNGVYSFTMPDNDVTVTAEFEAITYSVAFNKNSNDATGSMDNQSFTGGTAQNLTANGFTAPTGYHFAGWATSANGAVEYADGAEVSNLTAVNNDTVTLYAKWEANKHTVTYKVDGEVYGAVDTVAYGTALTAREAPTKTGYTFSGWSEIPETMPDHDIEITGTFSVDENYGKLNVADYKSGDTWTAPTQEGKVFAGWFADSEYTTPYMETTGYAYAKFIDESCITVKWQKRLDNPDPNKTDIRLVSTLDCGDYDSLHFVLTFTDNGFVIKDGQITRLYDSLDGFVNGENVSYTPDIFCEDSKYFAAYTVTGMPNSLYDTSLTAQVYIITLDGTRVDGTPLTFKVADDQSNN